MARGINGSELEESSVNDLEPYRRLVELQKEIARLAQENEMTSQHCAELRDKVADKVLKRRRSMGSQTLAGLPANVIRSNLA